MGAIPGVLSRRPAHRAVCTVTRTMNVQHGSVDLLTGKLVLQDPALETTRCGAPLVTIEEQRTGKCRSCSKE